MSVKAIPEGFDSITPNLVSNKAADAIEFYKKVFGATELRRVPGPDGKIMYAELQIGDSRIIINDSMTKNAPRAPDPGTSNPTYLHLYVPDVDTIFNRAVTAGSRVEMAVQDMFYGDRYRKLTDPYVQQWGIATHKEDVAPEEIARRQKDYLAKAAAGR